MDGLTQVLEKISTLNINANTNIDVQGIVEKYVLFDAIKHVGMIFLLVVGLVVCAYFIYRGTMKKLEYDKDKHALVEREKNLAKSVEILDGFQRFRTAEQINDKLAEIIMYMPRNKKKRNP